MTIKEMREMVDASHKTVLEALAVKDHEAWSTAMITGVIWKVGAEICERLDALIEQGKEE